MESDVPASADAFVGKKIQKAATSILFYEINDQACEDLKPNTDKVDECVKKMKKDTKYLNETEEFFDSLDLADIAPSDAPERGNRATDKLTAKFGELMEALRQEYFYQYDGSLTEPPCHEGVKWNVYARSLPAWPRHMKLLKKMFASYGDNGNARRTQPTNGRRVYFNTAAGGSFSNATFLTTSMAVVAAAATMLTF